MTGTHQDYIDKMNKHIETHKAVHENARKAAAEASKEPAVMPADRKDGMSPGRL